MPVISARRTLDALWLLLYFAKNRPLRQEERREVERLCEALKEGIPTRDIYNRVAREFSSQISQSGLLETGGAQNIQSLLERAESLKVFVG